MRSIALLLGLALTTGAVAGETAWQEVAPDARLRLISSDTVAADGTTMVGLEFDMPASTNTYWRVPGETGIPTTLDFAGSSGVAGHEILWPYPLIETATGYVDFVYRGPTVLPVRLKLDGDAEASVRVAVVAGICSDICVPVTASFDLALDAEPDRAQALRIAQAEATVPLEWTEVGDPVPWLGYDADAGVLAVAIGGGIDPESMIADTGTAGQLFGAPQKSPDGNLVHLPLLGGDAGRGVEGMPVRLTFMTDMGPFSLERRISSAGSTPAGE